MLRQLLRRLLEGVVIIAASEPKEALDSRKVREINRDLAPGCSIIAQGERNFRGRAGLSLPGAIGRGIIRNDDIIWAFTRKSRSLFVGEQVLNNYREHKLHFPPLGEGPFFLGTIRELVKLEVVRKPILDEDRIALS